MICISLPILVVIAGVFLLAKTKTGKRTSYPTPLTNISNLELPSGNFLKEPFKKLINY